MVSKRSEVAKKEEDAGEGGEEDKKVNFEAEKQPEKESAADEKEESPRARLTQSSSRVGPKFPSKGKKKNK
jgi:hypothetical protein